MAVREMIGLCANYALAPDLATATAVLIRNTIAAQSLLAAVEKALELTTSRMGKSAHRNRLPFQSSVGAGTPAGGTSRAARTPSALPRSNSKTHRRAGTPPQQRAARPHCKGGGALGA